MSVRHCQKGVRPVGRQELASKLNATDESVTSDYCEKATEQIFAMVLVITLPKESRPL